MLAHGKNRPQKWVEEAEACEALEVPMGVRYMYMFVQGMACRQNILISVQGRGRGREEAVGQGEAKLLQEVLTYNRDKPGVSVFLESLTSPFLPNVIVPAGWAGGGGQRWLLSTSCELLTASLASLAGFPAL